MDTAKLLKALEKPKRVVDVILDTDAYSDVDDQYAIAYLLSCSDRVSTKAIFAAPFLNKRSTSPADGMEKSYQEILKVLDLSNRSDMKEYVFKGSDRYLPDEKTPVISPAAEYLVEFSRNYDSDNRLYVVGIGAGTNVASAVLMDPTIIDRIVLVWLAGNSIEWPHNREANMMQDIAAGRVVFGSGLPLVQLPRMGVVSGFPVTQFDLVNMLRGKNAICDYLLDITIEESGPLWPEGYPWNRILWDVVAVAWLTTDGIDWLESQLIPSPIPQYDHTISSSPTRHPIRYVYHIERDCLMCHMCEKLVTL